MTGQEVIVHARSAERPRRGLLPNRSNQLGRVDAAIHDAGIYSGRQILPIKCRRPGLLTALINCPQRLVYLGSDMHYGGRADVAGVDWSGERGIGSGVMEASKTGLP